MALPYLIILVPAALAVLGAMLGSTWNLLVPAFVFGLVPLLDLVLGHNPVNPSLVSARSLAAHRLVALAAMPVLVGLVVFGAWQVTHVAMGWGALAALVLSTGICTGGIGITVAHELIHKSDRLDRLAGQLLLLNVAYMHFYIEHLVGHHGKVATPDDPASARLGESFYRFLPRTVLGSWRDAWAIERERLARLGLPVRSARNRMLWYAVLPVGYAVALGLAFGPAAMPFFAAQAVVGFSLLELVNYLEHYGLARQALPSGRYERVTVMHSWSSDMRLTNWFLLNLQRHADHHVNAARPYPALLHVDEAPQLPTGYAGMVLLALVPPLFRQVMDPLVAKHRGTGEGAGNPVQV